MGKQTGARSTIGMRESAASCTLLPLLVLFLFGCRTSAPSTLRYAVTATPVDVVSGGFGVCIAVDPADAQGVWWWQPGPSGCASRTTGPTVFAAERASVRASMDSGPIEVNFTLQLMSGPRDVTLVLQNSEMRVAASGVRVATQRRADLEIPPAYGR
jgi:hypothetical protein